MRKKEKSKVFSKAENHPMWVDYYGKLSKDEKDFLYKFAGEVYLGKFTDEPLHSKKAIKELVSNRNAQRRDVLNVSDLDIERLKPRKGRYSELDYAGKEENQAGPEDDLIDYLDKID